LLTLAVIFGASISFALGLSEVYGRMRVVRRIPPVVLPKVFAVVMSPSAFVIVKNVA
jgi:hypothetical protein